MTYFDRLCLGVFLWLFWVTFNPKLTVTNGDICAMMCYILMLSNEIK